MPLIIINSVNVPLITPRPKPPALQLAVETLLGLKNSQGAKGGGQVDEASAQAMAAVTAAAVSAAAAAAEAAAAHATAAGADNGSAASAAAAAAATAKAVAQAVAAAGTMSPTAKTPVSGGRSSAAPPMGEGKRSIPDAAAIAAAAEAAAAAAAAHAAASKAQAPAVNRSVAEAKDTSEGGEEGSTAREGAQAAWAPVHGGPEEAASEAVAGRGPPAVSRASTATAAAADVKQPGTAESGATVDVSGVGAANQSQAIASSV